MSMRMSAASGGSSWTDDFPRPDGPVGGEHLSPLWNGDSIAQILSGTYVSGGASAVSSYRGTLTGSDYEIEIVIASGPTSDYQTINIHGSIENPNSGSLNMYTLEIKREPGNAQVKIWRVASANGTQLANTFISAIVAGDRFKFSKIGSSLTGYRWVSGAWSSILSASDSTYGAGYPGLSLREGGTGAIETFIVSAPGVSNGFYSRTDAPAGAFTIMGNFWIRDRNAYSVLFQKDPGCIIRTMSDGLGCSILSAGLETTSATGITVADSWYHIAMTVASDATNAAIRFYVNGVQTVTRNRNGAAGALALRIGDGTDFLDGRVCNVMAYSAALSAGEILNQIHQSRPQRLTNMWGWWMPPGMDDNDALIDFSGNGRNLTANGNVFAEENPAIAYG